MISDFRRYGQILSTIAMKKSIKLTGAIRFLRVRDYVTSAKVAYWSYQIFTRQGLYDQC
jgi:hypothetical protein